MKQLARCITLFLLIMISLPMEAQFEAVGLDITILRAPSKRYTIKTFCKLLENKYIIEYTESRTNNSRFEVEKFLTEELTKDDFNRIADLCMGISSIDLFAEMNKSNVVIYDDFECVVNMRISIIQEASVQYKVHWPYGRQSKQGHNALYQIQTASV